MDDPAQYLTEASVARWIARDPKAASIAIDRELVRVGGLREFTRLAWHTVEGKTPYSHNWHIDAICDHLEAISRGELTRCAIAVPPRSMKSVSVAVMWPAWDWIDHAERRSLFSSYAHNLSKRDSARCRRVIMSPWYQERWGDRFSLTGDQNAKWRFENDRTGYRLATSVNGQLTGEGGDFVVVDDPLNSRDADSPLKRENMLTWWRESMSTRLNDPAKGAFLIIQQRLHESDLVGDLLKRQGVIEDGGEYTYLCYDNAMEILTEYGWVRFSDLQQDVRVMSVDPKTLIGTWEQPSGYLTKHYSGPMLHYQSQTCDLMVTPDHRMVYQDVNDWNKHPESRAKNWRVRRAGDCPTSMFLPQAITWTHEADTVIFGGREWGVELLGEFMGWFLAEGSTSLAYPYYIIIVQKDGEHADEIDACMRQVPFNHCHSRRRGNQRVWQFSRKALWQELAPLGKATEKCMPQTIKNLPARALRKLVMAYAKGDGHLARRNPDKITISSRSQRMIDDLQECALKAGWAASKNYIREKGAGHFPNGQKREASDVWKLYLRTVAQAAGGGRKSYTLVGPKNIKRPHYDGLVHCVSVPHGALVVRRNGRVTICGNCLPALFEPDHPNRWFRDPRTEAGELLWPEHVPQKALDALRLALGEYAFAAQMQQRPSPREGGLVKRAWLSMVRVLPPDLEYARGWDLAASEKKVTKSDPDWTATVKIGWSRSMKRWYIVDVRRWREGPATIEATIKQVTEEDAAAGDVVKVVLPKDPGQAGVAQSQAHLSMLAGHDVVLEPQSGDKVVRAMPLISQASGRNISVLVAPWNEDFLNELTGFPTGSHDDMVDAASSAFTRLTGGTSGLLEYYQRQLDAATAEAVERKARLAETGGVLPGLVVHEEETEDLGRALTMGRRKDDKPVLE